MSNEEKESSGLGFLLALGGAAAAIYTAYKVFIKPEVTEIELVEFIRTLNKLSKDNFMDKRNVKLVTKHFGFKKKKGWLKIEKGNKVQL